MYCKRDWMDYLHRLLSFVCALSMLFAGVPISIGAAAPPAAEDDATQALIAGPPGVSVYASSGDLLYHRTDLAAPAGGYTAIALHSDLTYDSAFFEQARGFGRGWRFGYDIAYQEAADGTYTAILWPDGREVRFTPRGGGQFNAAVGVYDTLTQPAPGQYRLETLAGVIYYFDNAAHRHVSRIEQRNGLALAFTYDNLGYLTAVQDDYGRRLLLDYTNGRVSHITNDFLNRAIILTYTGEWLTGITDAAGQTTAYAYVTLPAEALGGARTYLGAVTLPGGAAYAFRYDVYGRVLDITGSCGAWGFRYGEAETQVLREVEGSLRRTTYQFREGGYVTHVTDALHHTTQFEWLDHRPVTQLDAENALTRYTYDDFGHLWTEQNPLGFTTVYTYTGNDLTGVRDPLGHATTFTYDAAGNQISRRDPLGATHVFTYGAGGRLLAETGPLAVTTQYEYDAYGRRTVERNALAGVIRTTYDPGGGIHTRTDAAGRTITLTYDALSRPITYTDALGWQTTYAYDARGNLIAQTLPQGATYRFEYDALGYLTAALDPRGGVEQFRHDVEGHLRAATDANGHTWTFGYDVLGQLQTTTDPLNQTASYAYNRRGDLTAYTAPDGTAIAYAYDAAGQLVTTDFPGADDATYMYDAAGQMTEARNGQAIYRYAYDAGGNVTRFVQIVVGRTYTTTYTYDLRGRRVTMTDPDGGLTRYEYDALDRLTALSDPQEGTTTFAYNPAGYITRQTLPNGAYTTYDYDAAYHLLAVTHHNAGGAVLGGETCTYNANGFRTTCTDLATQAVTTYTYDVSGALIGYQTGGQTTTYFYDSAGNRVEVLAGAESVTYAYDAANQLLQDSAGGAYTYDARGNLIAAAGATYTYDANDRLTSAHTADGQTVTLAYGPDGRLVSRTDATGAVVYLYDELNPLLEKSATGATLTRYTATPDLDDLLAQRADGVTAYYLRDGRGSITALSDAAGAVTARYQYDPFGVPTTALPRRQPAFGGRPYDPALGLYDMRFRAYDPRLGRFLQRDPLGLTQGLNLYLGRDPLVDDLPGARWLNLYAYADNNPVNRADPLGWITLDQAQKILETGGEISAEMVKAIAAQGGNFLKALSQRVHPSAMSGLLGVMQTLLSDEGAQALRGAIQTVRAMRREQQLLCDLYGPNDPLCTGMRGIYKYFPPPKQRLRLTGYTPRNPPNRAGNDHSDDTASVASAHLPAVGATGIVRVANGEWRMANSDWRMANGAGHYPVYRQTPRVALLWNGFAEEAAAFLSSLGEPYDPLTPDFSPVVAAAYPVLLIPTGGLYGLENSAAFRARLEAYVGGGGILLVSAQQQGAEYAALPGGLAGYGWTEDQSCYAAAAYFPVYHQAASSFSEAGINALVDGYFTDYPTTTVSLLTRNKNGYPSAVLYPYPPSDSPPTRGNRGGYVVATTLYADWGRSYAQYGNHDVRFWRDLLAWATLITDFPLPTSDAPALPDFGPGENVAVNVHLVNTAGQPAAAARYILLNPNKQIVADTVVSATVAAGQAITRPYATTTGAELGVWTVDYLLLDDAGNTLQEQAIGAAFIVSDPAPAIGPGRPWDFWVTAPGEYWVKNTQGEFTFHLRNRTTTAQSNMVVRYGFPHHTWESGDPAYGNFDQLVHEVGEVAAGAEVSFTVQARMFTQDRLFGSLQQNGLGVNSLSFQIRPLPAAAGVTVTPERDSYYVGEPVVVTATLTNLEARPYDGIARLRAFTPARVEFATQDQAFSLGGKETTAVLTYTLAQPITPTFGLHTLQLEVFRDDQQIGGGQAHFELPMPRVTLTAHKPDAYHLNQSNLVTFTLTNQGGTPIADGEFALRLTAPDGALLWSGGDAFTLAGWETVSLTHALPFSTALGLYTYEYEVLMRGARLTHDRTTVAAAYAATRESDRSRYSGGETMVVTVTVQNIGDFEEPLTVQLDAPDAPFSQTQTLTPLTGGGAGGGSYRVPLSAGITGGVHWMTVTLATTEGVTSAKAFPYVILPAALRLALGAGPYQAGGALPVHIANTGGGVTDYTVQIILRDGQGRLIAVQGESGRVGGGETDIVNVPLPADIQAGSYTLQATALAQATNARVGLTRVLPLGGLAATLSAATQQPVYRAGQVITATAWVTNTGAYAIPTATLALEALSMLGGGPLAGVVQNAAGEPLPGARVTLDGGAQAVWTNLAGEYRFEGVGVGDHTFAVARVGYVEYAATHFVAGPQEPLILTLTPAATAHLSGVVRVSGGLTLVVGAEVNLSPQPSALSPQPSALSPQSSVLSPQPSVLSPQPSVLSPQPSALSPQPSALSPTGGRAATGPTPSPTWNPAITSSPSPRPASRPTPPTSPLPKARTRAISN